MATVALTDTTDDQIIEDDDTYVSSARTLVTRAILPEIDAGAGDTVAVGYEIRFEATGGGLIRVLTADGRLLGPVPGRGRAVLVAEAGNAESESDFWRFYLLAQPSAALPAVVTSGGAGATAGAFNSATQRDAAIVTINDIRTALIKVGILKAE